MAKFFIILGLVLLLVGLAWPLLAKLGLGRLPGDVLLQGDGGTFYFPIVTCLLLSALLTGIFWLLGR